MRPRLIAIGSTTRRNRIGRTYSLWLTARVAGLDFRYLTIDDGEVWEPLREDHEFLATIERAADLGELEQRVRSALTPETTVLVCKPRPELLALSRALPDTAPVVVDIDDPELLDPWGGASPLLRTKRIVRTGWKPHRFHWARRAVTTMTVITSNPLLQARYGGELVPHVREVAPGRRASRPGDGAFVVAFIGTVREHKGVEDLRSAVRRLARTRSIRLQVTAPAPADAEPWEDWVGSTSLARGRELLAGADVTAILSRPGVWGDLQLPVKLIDAMATGIPTVTTARPPLLWAAGGSSVVVRDGSTSDLADVLALLADDPGLANELGNAARERARSTFTPAAVAPQLVCAIERAESRARTAGA